MLLVVLLVVLSCNQTSNKETKNANEDEMARLKEINIKSCIKALLLSNITDTATAKEFCECSMNKMFEKYSYEEILNWNELSHEEQMRREEIINKDCEQILDNADY